jgi:Ni/Co efflux regulator RcnB
MKKILLPIVAVSALAATTVPALAQGYAPNNWNNWRNIDQRQQMLDRRIDQGVRNGSISRSEAIRLRAEFRQIARLEANYRRNGLNSWERADLDRRFDRLSAQIRFERRDRDYGYGYGDRDRDRDYGYGRR